MTILQRLERLPMARPQWRLLFQGGIGYTFDGMDGALVAFILPSATVVFSLSSSQTGLLGSSVLIGYLFGALSAGLLGDLIGRKRVMMYALAIYAAASVVAALSPSWGFLFWSRVVAGFGTGAESAIIAPFLAEFVAGRFRGRFIGSLAGAHKLTPGRMLCICLPALLVLLALALIAPACAELELLAAGPVRPPRLDELLDLLRPLRT